MEILSITRNRAAVVERCFECTSSNSFNNVRIMMLNVNLYLDWREISYRSVHLTVHRIFPEKFPIQPVMPRTYDIVVQTETKLNISGNLLAVIISIADRNFFDIG